MSTPINNNEVPTASATSNSLNVSHNSNHNSSSGSGSSSGTTTNTEVLKRPAITTTRTTTTRISKSYQAKKTRVLVLGAGMSGLACARELQQRGYQVLVVEARDRLGGRLKGGVKTNDKEGGNEGMKTLPTPISTNFDKTSTTPPLSSSLSSISSPLNDNNIKSQRKRRIHKKKKDTSTPVDLGGALIHGIDDNPIYALTEQMGIPTSPVYDCLLFNESGWPIDTREDDRISALFNECLEETFDRVNQSSSSAASSSPSSSAAVIEMQKETNSEPETNSKPTTPILHADDDSATDGKGEDKSDSSSRDIHGGDDHKDKLDTKPSPMMKNVQLDEQQQEEKDETNPDRSVESFGDVFAQVCKEKNAPVSHPLFQWQQANLEVSCGASFPDLGYKWNDDEPYGYGGAHVAVKTSWKPVMEGLAEGIDVLYQSPVKQVVMVVPDPPPPSPPAHQQLEQLTNGSKAAQIPSPAPEQIEAVPTSAGIQTGVTALASASKSKRKRSRSHPTTPLPSRRSRRLQGDNADARRSSRSNKGQKVDRFLVSEFSRDSYEDIESLRSSSQRNNRKKQHDGQQESDDSHTTVQVTLEDGTVLAAEAVVCTLPLGILKLQPDSDGNEKDGTPDSAGGGIRFYPPLSERKQQAIQRLGCGLLNKCVLSFSHVFWQDSDFLGLAHPANSYLILNVSTYTNKPILTFMYGGSFAKEIEAWKDNEIVADCVEVLRIICGKRDIPSPLDYTVTRWGHERYSRMSFSYVPPGVDGMEEYKAMSEAVYDPLVPQKPVLMFAGEHTSMFHPSTIHGAFLSGIREAYRLDLFVEAEANDHLEFDDEHLYQHTFYVRRQTAAAKSPVARTPARQRTTPRETSDTNGSKSSPGNKRQHRRRGAASVMNLRQRPKTILPDRLGEPGASSRRRAQQQDQLQLRASGQKNKLSISPARRSRRSVYSMQQQQRVLEENSNIIPLGGISAILTLKKAPPSDDEALLEKKHLASLESRTLMRSLESYGHDYSYIQEIAFPIFGSSTPPKSLPQVRARCQQLIRSIMSSASAQIPKRLLSSWVPKDIHVPPPLERNTNVNPVSKKPKSSRSKKTETKPRVEGSRRSARQLKQRTMFDL